MKSNTRCCFACIIVFCMTVFILYYFYWVAQDKRPMVSISHWNHNDNINEVKYTVFKDSEQNKHTNRPEIPVTRPPRSMSILDYNYIYTNLNESLEEFPIFVHGTSPFEKNSHVADCLIIADKSRMGNADAVVFRHSIQSRENLYVRPRRQRYVLFTMESPENTENFTQNGDQVNWTATYIKDSSILLPYETYNLYDESIVWQTQHWNYASGKTKLVAWFVSNCFPHNSRMEYAKELQKYIDVDIYGKCGNMTCPRSGKGECFQLLNQDYKFYLAFENSNCKQYITEKLFSNGLKHDVLPIVMGARPEDYRRVAPKLSYIHVDEFASPKQLANYLHKLNKNDTLYNEYFHWKGTGNFTRRWTFWEDLCGMLHNKPFIPTFSQDLTTWYIEEGECIGKMSWREFAQRNGDEKGTP